MYALVKQFCKKRDYQDKPEQNYYESDGVDDEQYDQMDHTSRREAEKAIRKRERAQSHENEKYGLRRIPQGLLPLEGKPIFVYLTNGNIVLNHFNISRF